MKCVKCQTDNPVGAKFCRNCAEKLPTCQEKWPNLKLVSPYTTNTLYVFQIFYFITFFSIIVLGCVGNDIMKSYDLKDYNSKEALRTFFYTSCFYFLILLYVYLNLRERKKNMISWCKYYSEKEEYVYVGKNDKLGLYNPITLKTITPPEYDKIKLHKKSPKIFKVWRDDVSFFIDAKNHSIEL